MPDVALLTGKFLDKIDGPLHFTKAAIAAIDFPTELSVANGKLKWLLSPKEKGY